MTEGEDLPAVLWCVRVSVFCIDVRSDTLRLMFNEDDFTKTVFMMRKSTKTTCLQEAPCVSMLICVSARTHEETRTMGRTGSGVFFSFVCLSR